MAHHDVVRQGAILAMSTCTDIRSIPQYHSTLDHKGVKTVLIAKSDDSAGVTGLPVVAMDGTAVHLEVLYKGKTNRCHPSVPAASGMSYWHTPNRMWPRDDMHQLWHTDANLSRFTDTSHS